MAGVVERAAQAIHNAGSAFDRGFGAATAPWNSPGAVQKVSPFEAGTVSPGAIALKSLASLIYGTRAQANARQQQQDRASLNAYRDAQTAKLKATAAGKPLKTYNVPGVGPVDLTDDQAASHAVQIRGPQETRTHTSAADAADLGVPYDPTTGSVNSRDASFAAARQLHHLVNDRITGNERTTQARLLESQHAAGAAKMLDDLDKQEADAADAYAESKRMAVEADARILQSTDRGHATARAEAARRLGVGPRLVQPDLSKPEFVPAKSGWGEPIYDMAQIAPAVKARLDEMRRVGLARAKSGNTAKRAALSQVHATMSGADLAPPGFDPNAPDPVLGALDHLARTYAPQQAPAEDDPFYDRPAP